MASHSAKLCPTGKFTRLVLVFVLLMGLESCSGQHIARDNLQPNLRLGYSQNPMHPTGGMYNPQQRIPYIPQRGFQGNSLPMDTFDTQKASQSLLGRPLWDYQDHSERSHSSGITKRVFVPTDQQISRSGNDNSNAHITRLKITPRVRDKESTLRQALIGLQNPNLFGGDILIKSDEQRTRRTTKNRSTVKFERSAMPSSVSLWPNGVIPFEVDPSVEHLADLIWTVMQQFHRNTCVKFIPRQNNEADYIRLESHYGCFSYIGRIGGEQIISLGNGCEHKGTIAHELLHVVGFYHQQNRSDRDDYLEILWENIAREKEKDFIKLSPHENLLLNEFDYNSIMLYGPRTFGKTLNKVTMKPKREGVIMLEIIEKQGLSALDIDSVNKLYGCVS